MWGNIAIETVTQVNFGIGFSNMKSEVLIHLSQWQYWWWFWFSYLWSIYYLLVLRVLRFRTLKFKPKIATTLRPHGKWGDLIVCIIPVSWCANILSNANLILRMLEWQAESGLFTVRIRGKQWYWVYKFELKCVTDILSAPKNSGRNKWTVFTPGDTQTADDYLHILQLRAQNKWVQKYWKKELIKNTKTEGFNVATPLENYATSYNSTYRSFLMGRFLCENSLFLKHREYNKWYKENRFNILIRFTVLADSSYANLNSRLIQKKKQWFFRQITKEKPVIELSIMPLNISVPTKNYIDTNLNLYFNTRRGYLEPRKTIFFRLKQDPLYFSKYFKQSNDMTETTRWLRRLSASIQPVKLIKHPASAKVQVDENPFNSLLRFRFTENNFDLSHKPLPNSTFLSMKQKRYKRRRIVFPRQKFIWTLRRNEKKIEKFSAIPNLIDNAYIEESDINTNRQYRMMKKKRNRTETTSVISSRRLLRTKRTLVLPAHVNITAVTNSYDVVHSWFIPGLGLKMDCIPGRSTHHTFHVDNVGFYYGQCAEVCGRFHHHMPIRICALPYEHFLLWWNTFGLPRLLFTRPKKEFQVYYGFRKYVW
jgi:heme/copper-type cytochrome/quinol oxidase subunit 2